MTTRLHHRTLTDHLNGWDADRIAGLLVRRPDLAHPSPPADVKELAQRAQSQPSVVRAVTATTLPENRLLQLVVCCRPDVPLEELAEALPAGVALADLEDAFDTLEGAALVWRHDGRVHCSGTLRQAVPTTLGPPLQSLVKDQTVDYLKATLAVLRRTLDDAGAGLALPPAAIGPDGRPPRKAELVDELEALLAAPGAVEEVLATGSVEAADIARRMADGKPSITLQRWLYFSRYSPVSSRATTAESWLYERALLLPGRDDVGFQPREVGVALRGGRPVADMALARPSLAVRSVEATTVDDRAAARAVLTLDRLSDVLERWDAEPVKALKSGGLGVSTLKQTAAALDVDVVEAGRLIELSHLAGLVESTTTSRQQGRKWVYETVVAPTPEAADWIDRSVQVRWAQLATAWLRAACWPSAAGHKPADGTKAEPLLGYRFAVTAPDRRREVLTALAHLDPGQASDESALAARVYWDQPLPWLQEGVDPLTGIGWVHDEAELLGLVAAGALSSAGRALLVGDRRAAEEALAAAVPQPVRSFTLQADLTATVVGNLERELLVELRLMADVESSGAASTWRFSDASLRRALDAGRDAEEILSFLEDHADKGVPKPLAYLVADVARRHGNLVVGAAASFVVSHDPAVLADACSHRRTRKLGLRSLAPTVAVSPHPVDKVLDGLRDAGFLPTADGEDPASVTLGSPRPEGSSRWPQAGSSNGTDLVEPFRAPDHMLTGEAMALDEGAALRLARSVIAGAAAVEPPSPVAPGRGSPRHAGPGSASLPFGDHDDHDDHDDQWDDDAGEILLDSSPEALDALLQLAVEESLVVAIVTGDRPPEEPILLVATGWEVDRVVGFDLIDGTPMVIPADAITSAIDLGPADELTNLVPLGGSRRRSGGNRRGRR